MKKWEERGRRANNLVRKEGKHTRTRERKREITRGKEINRKIT